MALPTKITLKIVTPMQNFSHEVDEVSMPGTEGDFGVLPGHTPFFTSIRTGTMWYRKGTEKFQLAVSMGFAEVMPDTVTVIAQVAERAEDLDQARAEEGMARAAEQLGPVVHDIDFETARLALLKTIQEMQAESRRPVR